MSKKYCDCGKPATWIYMPGFREGSPFFCDDCVHRGCSCNHRYVSADAYHPPLENPDVPEGVENVDWKWVDEEKTIWANVDENGRFYPCCEYDYDEDNFDWDDDEE